jgi:hypothetical protein
LETDYVYFPEELDALTHGLLDERSDRLAAR